MTSRKSYESCVKSCIYIPSRDPYGIVSWTLEILQRWGREKSRVDAGYWNCSSPPPVSTIMPSGLYTVEYRCASRNCQNPNHSLHKHLRLERIKRQNKPFSFRYRSLAVEKHDWRWWGVDFFEESVPGETVRWNFVSCAQNIWTRTKFPVVVKNAGEALSREVTGDARGNQARSYRPTAIDAHLGFTVSPKRLKPYNFEVLRWRNWRGVVG